MADGDVEGSGAFGRGGGDEPGAEGLVAGRAVGVGAFGLIGGGVADAPDLSARAAPCEAQGGECGSREG